MRARAILSCLVLLAATLTGVALSTTSTSTTTLARAAASPQPYVTPEAVLDRLALHEARASRSRQVVAPKASMSPRAVHPPRKSVTVRSHRRLATVHYSTGSLKAYAASLVGVAQMSCLDPLWGHESGWSVTNSYGSAYGIPQAKPGYKMASEGADWRTNGRTQIRWGVKYIAGRYGSACNAWSHYQRFSWY
jgi:hypothetical protein